MYEALLVKEPSQKWNPQFLELEMYHESDNWRRWNFDKKRFEALTKLGKERREEILKTIKSGITLGEVSRKLNLPLDVVSDVLYYNIDKALLIRGFSK